MRRTGLVVLTALTAAVFAGEARAEPPAVVLDGTPLVANVSEPSGWRTLLVRVENKGATPVEGHIDVEPANTYRSRERLTTRIPFSLVPGGRASVEAPTRFEPDTMGALELVARDKEGRELGRNMVSEATRSEALILELANPGRIAPALRGALISSRRSPTFSALVVAVGAASAPVDGTTGDLRLPTYPAGYSGATLVVAPGRALSRLGEAERSALANWVLSGGALAVAIDRPEDLRAPLLVAALGEAPVQTDAPDSLHDPQTFWIPRDEGSSTGPRLQRLDLSPSRTLSASLRGYRAPNLRETPWGSAASYGLGEVHLLAFDPEANDTLSDPWARQSLADLTRHAFDRRSQVALRHGGGFSGSPQIDGVRRNLDPNQASRWTIVVSALALLAYAALAGPLSFYLAQRRGRPLSALLRLPLWSAGTFVFIVGLGIFGKGLSGKSRKLSLVEAGAGMTRAASVHFRGFYAASSQELMIRPSRRENVLDLAGDGDSGRALVIDRDGPRLTAVRTRPWQTLLVREDGFVELAGGVSIVPDGGDYVVKNRVGRALLGVVVRLPDGEAHYFPRLADGASARVKGGKRLGALGGFPYPGSKSLPLDARGFSSTLDADSPGLGRAWTALEPTLPNDVEWWSNDVPVLIAALDGGEGKLSDSGLKTDYDRMLLRVVGTGGLP